MSNQDKPSIQELRTIASRNRHWNNGENSEGECGKASRNVADDIQRQYPSLENHSLKCQGYVGNNSIGHYFVVVPQNKVSDNIGGHVIVDPAIEQFCEKNANDDDSAINEALKRRGNPVRLDQITYHDFVITPNSDWYNEYSIDWSKNGLNLHN